MTNDTSAPTLVYDYELMENYVIASPLGAFTDIAAVTDPSGLAEAFLIGGVQLSVVNHVCQDPTSDTGWSNFPLPAVPDGTTITAIAAIVGGDLRRIVVVATAGQNVYAILETRPGSETWNNWNLIASTMVTNRLVLKICNNTILLAATAQYGVYGSVTNWQVVSGQLNFAAYPPTWTRFASFNTDLSLCDFVYDTTITPNVLKVTGCVNPTLSLFTFSNFSSWIWSTKGGGSYSNLQSSIYHPISLPSGAVLLSDLVVANCQVPNAPLGSSVLCAGSIEDLSGSSGPSLITLATDVTAVWNDCGTHTNLSGTLWQPNPQPNYTLCAQPANAATTPASCWFMSPGTYDLYPKSTTPSFFIDGNITVGSGTQVPIGLIRDDLMQSTSLASQNNPIFTTTDRDSDYKLTILPFQDTQGFSNLSLNCGVIADDNFGFPTFFSAYFPPAAITRLSGVLVQCAIGVSTPVLSVGRSNNSVFTNWCQVVKTDGSAYSFAVDDVAGNLWYVESLEPGGTWQNLSALTNLSPSPAFSPSSAGMTTLGANQATDGTVQVFAIGSDGVLYWITETALNSNTFNDPMPVDIDPNGVAAFALVPPAPAHGFNSARFFAISNSPTPVLYFVSLAGSDAVVSVVQLQNSASSASQIQPISAYTVDAHLKDADGALMGGAPVTIATTEPCTAIVNGSTARVVPGITNTFFTNASGGLHLIVPTVDISAPQLTFAQPGAAPLLPPISLNQKVIQNLAQMTNAQFSTAVDASNNLLFPNAATCKAVWNAVTGLCQFAFPPPGGSSASPTSGAVSPLGQSWEITFDESGNAAFTPLPDETPGGGERKVAALPKSSPGGWPANWWNYIFGAAKHKIITVTQKAAADGLQVTITVKIENAITQYSQLLQSSDPDLFNELLDLSTAIMFQAGALVAQIAQWLSLRFDWNQINLTAQAVQYTVKTCFSLLASNADAIKTAFDNQFTSGVFSVAGKDLTTAISSLSQQMLQAVNAFEPVSDIADLALPRVQCSFLSAHLKDFCDSPLAQPPKNITLTPGLTNLLNEISPLGTSISVNNAVQSQITALSTPPPITSDQQLQQTVSTASSAMQSVVTSLISLVQQAVDDVLTLSADDLNALQTLLDTEVYVPWVWELYQLRFGPSLTILGPSLTILGLISVAIAIPAETAFEALAGRAPFAGSTDLLNFEAGFTTNNLQAIWGLAQSGWQTFVTPDSLLRLQDAVNLLSLGAAFTRVYVDQLLDSIAAGQLTMQNSGSFFLSVADISSSLALFASSACDLVAKMVANAAYAPNVLTTVALASVGAHWAIDTLFTCAPTVAKTLRLDEDAGICMDMALSLASTSLYTLVDGLDYGTSFSPDNPPIALGGDILSALSAVGHIGLVSGVVDTNDGASVPIVLLMDYIADQYQLWTIVQAMQPASASAQSA